MPNNSEGLERALQVDPDMDPLISLYNEVKRVLDADNGQSSGWQVRQVQVPINTVDPFLWLHCQKNALKFYWRGRHEKESIASVGVADQMSSISGSVRQLNYCRSRLEVIGNARYFGGLRFDPTRSVSDEWANFGIYRFFLPRFELHSSKGGAFLSCNLVLPRDQKYKSSILQEISDLILPAHLQSGELQLPIARVDSPSEKEWAQIILHLLNHIENEDDLAKVVLARKVTFSYAEEVDRLLLFKQLQSITHNHFHFYFQFDSASAFMGATPERLYRRQGRYIESEAVAGTGKRAGVNSQDAAFASALLESEKDQREHAFVRDGILKSMAPLCDEMQIDSQASVLNLNMGRHLLSKFWGVLKDRVSDIEILEKLHPTSAVGGYPTDQALEAIREAEPFDRGWYSGPVGWIGSDEAEFSVAIRSALVQGNRVSLYSGAGIVQGSLAASEWEEIEQKNSDFIRVLGLDQRSTKY